MSAWLAGLAAALASAALRLAPEVWLRGRAPPPLLARSLPWLPVVVCGVLVAALHIDQPANIRTEYLVASIPAGLTLLWRRSFYLPIIAGAVALALFRRVSGY